MSPRSKRRATTRRSRCKVFDFFLFMLIFFLPFAGAMEAPLQSGAKMVKKSLEKWLWILQARLLLNLQSI